jgi:hypothetical protein
MEFPSNIIKPEMDEDPIFVAKEWRREFDEKINMKTFYLLSGMRLMIQSGTWLLMITYNLIMEVCLRTGKIYVRRWDFGLFSKKRNGREREERCLLS